MTLSWIWKTALGLSFFAWTTSQGILSFTDDSARIPSKYRAAAIERTWDDLRAATDKRWTVDTSR